MEECKINHGERRSKRERGVSNFRNRLKNSSLCMFAFNCVSDLTLISHFIEALSWHGFGQEKELTTESITP